jgi:hypothetical protein
LRSLFRCLSSVKNEEDLKVKSIRGMSIFLLL